MIRKELGKITKAEFGLGGYQDAMYGLIITLEFGGGAVGDFKGTWKKRSEHAQYTEAEYAAGKAEAWDFITNLLRDARKQHISKLVGTPVEVTTEHMMLKSWRVLTEVL